MYDRIKTQGFKYKRGYDLRNDLAGVTHGLGCGGTWHLRERCKKKQITLFSYLMVLIRINHGVATAEKYYKYPGTPY